VGALVGPGEMWVGPSGSAQIDRNCFKGTKNTQNSKSFMKTLKDTLGHEQSK
jgi:hypothetical protein